ncbi:AAA family ATPase [Bradyrhizobium symbiodeficiens]|uniref:AAA family ATPase n=1 Tax=Bradyrhizobium symbiodeficiens TaxID=1404367 RepID=UPI00140F7279|nr:AAA family ATPase [Bradyrhizobium symbiodeficiens]QIO98359.1 AAA family ATPase [Bradyrhizobium symbiodeficiens]
MKLVSAHITNFRSVEDSERFGIEQVTCLVGKNEAGKSAILLALAALNPHPSTPIRLDLERDYPRRHLTAYEQRHGDDDAVAVSTTWRLEQKDVEPVTKAFGDGILTADTITIRREYNAKGTYWTLPLDTQRLVDNLLATRGFDAAQLSALSAATTPAELAQKIETIPELTEPQQQFVAWLKKQGLSNFYTVVRSYLESGFPTFMYFSNYDRMDGAVQFEQLQQLKANGQLEQDEYSGARLFLEFMEYAGVPLDDILKVNTYETFNAKLQGASNNITDQILEYWTQNPDLEVRVDVSAGKAGDKAPFNSGTVGRARIYNQLHRVDTPFSERSAGFVWFFSFLVKFAQVKALGRPVVLLLDEPGLTLHGKAQADLLRYFDEKLAPHHQIIYSTHSPFMVAPDKLMSARVVEDVIDTSAPRRLSKGTKVHADVLSKDPDTLFPLQGALGYEITQTLFIGKHNLLVEGPSDILYLQVLSDALKARKRIGLDPRWTVCPTGGIGNVRAFVSLFGGNKLDVAVLADQTKGDLKKIEDLRRSEILKKGRVYTIADFTGKDESDIEDLFEPETFVTIVNACYELTGKNKLTAKSLEEADTTTARLVKKAEAAFKLYPESIPMYDHFTPSAWLIRNPSTLDGAKKETEATLARAENLFKAMNCLLP